MSYDLNFTRPGATSIQIDALAQEIGAFLSERSNYSVESDGAHYENPDTGVEFWVGLGPDEFEDEDEDGGDPVVASFNMNYARPHYYALEAAEEIEALVSSFKLGIHDPQNDGHDGNRFDRDGFVESWNSGNRFAMAYLSQSQDPLTLPLARQEQMWRWNRARKSLPSGPLADVDLWVPKIMTVAGPTGAGTMAVWPEAMPALLPEVDYLFVTRDEMNLKRFLRRPSTKLFVPFEQLRSVLEPYATDRFSAPAYQLPDLETPRGIVKAVTSLNYSAPVEAVPPYLVMSVD